MVGTNQDCVQRDRLINIEKKITGLETTHEHYAQELKEGKEALKECTQAINLLREDISANKGIDEFIRWAVPISITILLFILSQKL